MYNPFSYGETSGEPGFLNWKDYSEMEISPVELVSEIIRIWLSTQVLTCNYQAS
jgi:hypothetical protein